MDMFVDPFTLSIILSFHFSKKRQIHARSDGRSDQNQNGNGGKTR